MSIHIKGMETPKCCAKCYVSAKACRLWKDVQMRTQNRHPDCPIEEIPAGVRLIDANKMRQSVKFTGGTGDLFKEWIDRQPTVIETEGDQ